MFSKNQWSKYTVIVFYFTICQLVQKWTASLKQSQLEVVIIPSSNSRFIFWTDVIRSSNERWPCSWSELYFVNNFSNSRSTVAQASIFVLGLWKGGYSFILMTSLCYLHSWTAFIKYWCRVATTVCGGDAFWCRLRQNNFFLHNDHIID